MCRVLRSGRHVVIELGSRDEEAPVVASLEQRLEDGPQVVTATVRAVDPPARRVIQAVLGVLLRHHVTVVRWSI